MTRQCVCPDHDLMAVPHTIICNGFTSHPRGAEKCGACGHVRACHNEANYPSHQQHLDWYAEFQEIRRNHPTKMFSLEDYGHYLAQKCCDWQRERDAKVCDELRVSGGGEWTADHLGAIKALADAAAGIRALGARDCPACLGFGKRTVIDPDERMAVTDTCGRCGGSGLEKAK